jgi:mannosyl-3-phosphoglycerate phosphatase
LRSFEVVPPLLIFSDLDGTLLDAQTYSFDPVRPVLKELRLRGIPLIMCSSKTRMEMEIWREKLGLDAPFIVENGSAIVLPSSWMMMPEARFRKVGESDVMELGLPHKEICAFLEEISRIVGVRLRGLSQMSPEEVMERTGLSREEAKLAKDREYSEPFVVEDEVSPEAFERLVDSFSSKGLTYTRGGRFHHLMGATDKGKAIRILIETVKDHVRDLKTIALGDSPNDVPMLRAVDLPVLVQRPDGTYSDLPPDIKCHRAKGIGPLGWAAAVQMLLEDEDLPGESNNLIRSH